MLANLLQRLGLRSGQQADAGKARLRRMIALSELVKQGDPDQLKFQISEIAGDRMYTRQGVTVDEGSVVLDVGGNVGVSAVYFSQCGAARVHSFEPVPDTFELLRRNVDGIAACEPHPFGLAAAPGPAEMTIFSGGDSVLSGIGADPEEIRGLLASVGRNLGLADAEAERRASERCEPSIITAEFSTVSEFLRTQKIERVDLLKIDVEGAELQVFEGICEADWPKIRQIAGEIHSDELAERIESMLVDHGFRVKTEQDPLLSGTPVEMLYAVR